MAEKTVRDLCNDFLSHTKIERLNSCVVAASELIDYLKSVDVGEDEKTAFFFSAIGLFIDADQEVSQSEADLFNEIFNTKFTVYELSQDFRHCSNPDFVDAMDKIIDTMPQHMKANVCYLGLEFLAVDGKITEREYDLFEKILA